MLLPPPDHLLDADQLARNIWEFWVSVCKTDRLVDAEEMPDWDEMDDGLKLCFVEALSTQVVKPLQRYTQDVEFESSLDATFSDIQEGQPKAIPCYVCARNPVSQPGKVCSTCFRSHIPERR